MKATIIGIILTIVEIAIVTGIIILKRGFRPQNTKKKTKEEHIKENYINQDEEIKIYPFIKKYLLTQNEYNFYKKLKEITDPLNLQILAKIRLADLIEVDIKQVGKEYMKYFGKIKSKHIDFAIADNMKIIALLELDDSSHNKEERKERDNFVNNALLKVGYTVIRTKGNTEIVKKALIDKGYHENLYQNTIQN